MAKTRYAIVKVNNHCPSRFVDNVKNKYVCKIKQAKGGYILNCNCCRYGDTKEQMIKKIMTAFIIAIKKNKEGKFVKEKSINRQVAEIVVEFLGVAE